MIKRGDILICKKTYIYNTKTFFKKGKKYKIIDFEDDWNSCYIQYREKIDKYDTTYGSWLTIRDMHKDYTSRKDYIYNIFYSREEIRKKKIKTILK